MVAVVQSFAAQASTGTQDPGGISAVLASEPAGVPLRGFLKRGGIPAENLQILRGSESFSGSHA